MRTYLAGLGLCLLVVGCSSGPSASAEVTVDESDAVALLERANAALEEQAVVRVNGSDQTDLFDRQGTVAWIRGQETVLSRWDEPFKGTGFLRKYAGGEMEDWVEPLHLLRRGPADKEWARRDGERMIDYLMLFVRPWTGQERPTQHDLASLESSVAEITLGSGRPGYELTFEWSDMYDPYVVRVDRETYLPYEIQHGNGPASPVVVTQTIRLSYDESAARQMAQFPTAPVLDIRGKLAYLRGRVAAVEPGEVAAVWQLPGRQVAVLSRVTLGPLPISERRKTSISDDQGREWQRVAQLLRGSGDVVLTVYEGSGDDATFNSVSVSSPDMILDVVKAFGTTAAWERILGEQDLRRGVQQAAGLR